MTGSRWDGVDFGEFTCRELVELVTDYLEQRLDPPTRARFDQHIAVCPGCGRYLDQIRASITVLGRVGLDPLSDRARARLLDAFRSWRSDAPGDPT